MSNKFFMMIGVPGSGKSRFVDGHFDGNSFMNDIILSTDNLIEKWAKENNSTYSEAFELNIGPATQEITNKFNDLMGKTEFDHEYTVVLDRTNLTRKSRSKWLDKIPADWYVTGVVFVPETDKDMSVIQERLKSRPGKIIPDDAFKKMVESFQVPSILERRFDEIYYYDIYGNRFATAHNDYNRA